MDTKQLKAKILDLAIHGKLLPLKTLDGLKNSPDYEPASKLLEKLRAEKEEKIAKGELKRDKKDSYIFTGDDNRHYEKFADGSVKNIEDEIPFEAPEGWAIVHPNQIGTFQGGKTPSEDKIVKTGNIPYFKVSDMNVYGNEMYMNIVSNYLKDNCSYRLFPKDSIIYPKNGGAVFTNKKRILIKPSLIDLNSGAFIPSESINNLYAYYLFLSIDFNQFYKGSAVPTVDHDLINELYWGLPPISEQKLIVAEIEKIFNLIDSIETDKSALLLAVKQAKAKILDLAIHGKLVPQDPADEPAAALLEKLRAEKEAKIAKGELKRDKNDSYIYKSTTDNCHYEKFSDGTEEEIEVPFEIPSSWSWCRLGTICDYGKCKNASAGEINDETWVLDLEDIEKDSGRILKFVSFKVRKSASTKHIFKKGDILYSKLRPYLNKVVIAPKDGVCTSEILPLDFNGILINEFAQYLLMSSFFLESINLVTYGIKMPRLGTDDAKKMLLPVPPLNEQLGIVKKIKQFQVMLDQIALNLV